MSDIPNSLGFMLDHYDLNESKKITHIYPGIGDYALNLYSSHILEYELLRAFEKAGGNKNFDEYNIMGLSSLRKHIHQPDSAEYNIEEILYTEKGDIHYLVYNVS